MFTVVRGCGRDYDKTTEGPIYDINWQKIKQMQPQTCMAIQMSKKNGRVFFNIMRNRFTNRILAYVLTKREYYVGPRHGSEGDKNFH